MKKDVLQEEKVNNTPSSSNSAKLNHHKFAPSFSADYSIKGTAKCQVCNKTIPKGDLRIGKTKQFMKKVITQFYHVPCSHSMFLSAKTLKNVIQSESTVKGFQLLRDNDKETVLELISSIKPVIEKIKLVDASVKSKPKNSIQQQNIPNRRLKSSATPSINILYTNVDQLTSVKKTELELKIAEEKPLIIALCEVKSKNGGIRELVEYDLNGYKLFQSNLEGVEGRGIAVYVHNSIVKSVQQIHPKIKFEESCLLEIKLRGFDTMLFGCMYRSPTPSPSALDNNLNLNKLFLNLCSKKYSHICLVGDFNYKKVNWINLSTSETENSQEYKFLECVQDCFLIQHTVNPTRIRGTNEPSLLDLIFTNEEHQISSIHHQAPLGKSDHCVMTFKYSCYVNKESSPKRYVYHKGDYDAMREELLRDNWCQEYVDTLEEKSVEVAWTDLKNKFHALRNRYIPLQSSASSWKARSSTPIDKDVQQAIRTKHRLHAKWIQAEPEEKEKERLLYVRARNRAKSLLRKTKMMFEKNISDNAKSNPKKFWSYVRSKMKTRAGIAPLLRNPNVPSSLCFTDQEKARILQEQFCSVFVNEPNGNVPVLNLQTNVLMEEVTFDENDVKSEINSINKNKSSGPDDIDIKMLHELLDNMLIPITRILQKSFNSGTLPKDWLDAIVTPVFKKGSHNKAENYRPISLTSIVCKVLESILKKKIVKHFVDQSLFAKEQHGFIGGRSTTTQLLKFIDDCLQSYVLGGVIDAIYLDFAKAFDTVPHKRLISKLEAYGINGKVLAWIKGFLNNRTQRVRVNGEYSNSSNVISGIPQGSVLGPILFVIYINDLPREIKSRSLLFADDTKIYRLIKSIADSNQLQKDLDCLVEWSKKWLLAFNESKCHVLSIGDTENIVHAHYYKMDGVLLEHVFEEKDLGVIVDHQLTFADHIMSKIKKGNAMAGLIRRSFTYLEPISFKKLYVALVRPHLEYCQPVWSPHLRKYIAAIEKVQMRATKSVNGFQNLTYEERLRRLNLPTLHHRRKRGDLIEVYKHATTYDKAAVSPMPFLDRPSRKHRYQLRRIDPGDGVRGKRRNSFYYRTPALWNNLPREVAEAETVNSFKEKLDEHWQEDHNRFTIENEQEYDEQE